MSSAAAARGAHSVQCSAKYTRAAARFSWNRASAADQAIPSFSSRAARRPLICPRTAVTRYLEAKAIGEALDRFQVPIATGLIGAAKRATDKKRLSTLSQLKKTFRTLARAAKVLFEEPELVKTHGTDLHTAVLCRARRRSLQGRRW
ncbi:hypothetical protein [Streptomyces cyaneofuscatus]|uniref:hypothetical protein n=1 Tax=Streptomyces cyaneofuscatus TaxID=66883 RepID=UPI00380733F9